MRRIGVGWYWVVLLGLAAWLCGSSASCGQRKSLGGELVSPRNYAPKLLEEPVAEESEETMIARYGTYTVAYHLGWRQPQWVAYRLDASRLANVVSRKGFNFCADPLLANYTLDNASLKNTAYSRGHLKPAADSKSSETAMRESFYYTNMSPQLPRFNNGIWNSLEMWVRRCAEKADILYVVTGPCFLGPPIEYAGDEKVPVATHFYKAILKRSAGNQYEAVGFVVPHGFDGKAKPWEFAVSIDSLEVLTKIDFFPMLDDRTERVVEANVDPAAWR